MNIQSMTGYGRGEDGNSKVEVRSSNHRGLYIQLNVPSYLYFYEPDIRTLIKEYFNRGRIEVFISKTDADNAKININRAFAKEYYNALVSLKEELSITENIGINILANHRDIFSSAEDEVDLTSFRSALENALRELKDMRLKEGKNLIDDIALRAGNIREKLDVVEDKRKDFIKNARAVLAEKLKELLGNSTIDESRIIQEAAILVDKSDITEEIIRLRSHLKHLGEILSDGDIIGKKLDFLAQELHRELNTIGSKSTEASISTLVVDMKHELEKIREQCQNIQ